ncbi:tumor protein inducible nuclear protein 2 [Cricetulus griseus]|nr:tumor protein inducible nuclear protein 2 [Cricetulus griseus]
MFQRFTSLFFSTPSPPEDSNCPGAFVSEEDEVDGWLIIGLQEGPGLGPARLQSNPLEDLLIEHPSMSVYVTGSTIVLESGPPSPHPDAVLPEEDLSDGELAPARREPRALHHAAAAALPARAALLEKAGQVQQGPYQSSWVAFKIHVALCEGTECRQTTAYSKTFLPYHLVPNGTNKLSADLLGVLC